MNPELPLEAPPAAPLAPAPEAQEAYEDRPEFQGADAWKADAVSRVQGLWSGDSRTISPVFGVAAPEELVAFEQATRGADQWDTLYELRLDTSVMGLPSEDRNLFGMSQEPRLTPAQARRILLSTHLELPEAGRQFLRDELEAIDLEDDVSWRETFTVQMAEGVRPG